MLLLIRRDQIKQNARLSNTCVCFSIRNWNLHSSQIHQNQTLYLRKYQYFKTQSIPFHCIVTLSLWLFPSIQSTNFLHGNFWTFFFHFIYFILFHCVFSTKYVLEWMNAHVSNIEWRKKKKNEISVLFIGCTQSVSGKKKTFCNIFYFTFSCEPISWKLILSNICEWNFNWYFETNINVHTVTFWFCSDFKHWKI